MNNSTYFRLLLASLTTVSTVSFAEPLEITSDFSPSSSVSLTTGTDSDQNKNNLLQLNIELKGFQQINAGFGDSTSQVSALNTTQYYAGLASNPYNTFSAGIEYSKWGKNESLNIENLKTDFFTNTENWSFSISPQISTLSIYANNGKQYNIRSKGLSLSATYYGVDQYFFSVNALQNEISDAARFLDTPALTELALSRIPVNAQLLISGIEKNRQGFSAGRFFHWGSIELDWTQSQAELFDDQYRTLSLIVDYQLSTRFDLFLISSRQASDNSKTPLRAIDLGIAINW